MNTIKKNDDFFNIQVSGCSQKNRGRNKTNVQLFNCEVTKV